MLKRVDKVWGHEEWIVNNELYCGKFLYLNKDWKCSLHYHKNKDETFYILSGKVSLEIDGKTKILHPGQAERILPYMKHRFTGTVDSVIIEFSTHHEEDDSYRIEESGRAK
jgi:mannose-6-phosphate isomerase-like protein (cupin superfamily)